MRRFIISERTDFFYPPPPVCRAAGSQTGKPVQGDVCCPASKQPRGFPVWRLQFNGQGLGLSQLQGPTY